MCQRQFGRGVLHDILNKVGLINPIGGDKETCFSVGETDIDDVEAYRATCRGSISRHLSR